MWCHQRAPHGAPRIPGIEYYKHSNLLFLRLKDTSVRNELLINFATQCGFTYRIVQTKPVGPEATRAHEIINKKAVEDPYETSAEDGALASFEVR